MDGSRWCPVASTVVFVVLQLAASDIAARFGETDEARRELAGLVRLGALFVPLTLTQVFRYCTQAYKTMVPSVVVGNIIQPVVPSSCVDPCRIRCAGCRFRLGHRLSGGALGGAHPVPADGHQDRKERPASESTRSDDPIRSSALFAARHPDPRVGSADLGGVWDGSRCGSMVSPSLSKRPGPCSWEGSSTSGPRWSQICTSAVRWSVCSPFTVQSAMGGHVFLAGVCSAHPAARTPRSSTLVAVLRSTSLCSTGPTGFLLSMTGRPGINFVNSAVGGSSTSASVSGIVPASAVALHAVVTAIINNGRVIEVRIFRGYRSLRPLSP